MCSGLRIPLRSPCLARHPWPIVPTEVSEEATTVETRTSLSGYRLAQPLWLFRPRLMSPFALTVKVGIAVEEPKLPALPLFTDASVRVPPIRGLRLPTWFPPAGRHYYRSGAGMRRESLYP